MASGREMLREFIEKYRELECLWQVKHKDYRNKLKRSTALEMLLQIMKKTDKKANIDSVTKKINSLRSSFNKEHNKVKASCQSASGLEQVHVPKLWFYDQMLFLTNRDTESKSEIDGILSESSSDSQGMESITKKDESSPHSQCCVFISDPLQNTKNTTNSSKNKYNNTFTEVLTKKRNIEESSVSKPKPEFRAFGEHVAEKLRTMNEDAAKYCQKIINDAIFHAEFNNLNCTSRIVTDHLQNFHPQNQTLPFTPIRLPYQSHQQLHEPSLSSSTQSCYQSPD